MNLIDNAPPGTSRRNPTGPLATETANKTLHELTTRKKARATAADVSEGSLP
ncbi:hypothetical protein ACQCSU_04285 [Pseudarthrobacter sp. O4]|uniref:hypothetical protein n=1 Tax=Pseudarthrobacter sp. O4 TaxID=3418417 RepID=UPI003CEF48D2